MEYYAHTSEDGMRRQTVAAHCRKAASYAAECLSSVGLSNTAYLAGLMHDTGKLTQEYQTYLERAARGEAVRRGSVVHTFAGVRFLLEHYHGSKHDSSFNDITCELLAFAVGAHHGLFDCIDENHASGFLHRLQSHDSEYQEAIKNAEMHLITRDETNQLFQASCEEMSIIFEKIQKILDFESSQENDLYFYVSLIARLLLSAVIQGDRRDTTEFVTGISRLPHTKDMRDMWNAYLQHMEQKLSDFSSQTDIQKARRKISDQCRQFSNHPGGVYHLNVPTGAGKTLSSLRYALAHAAKWNKSRIIFTAPLLTILDQNAKVIRDFIGDNSIILEHHSNLIRTQETAEQLDTQELLLEDWSAPVIITTLAQLLNTFLDGKTSSIRRFQALADSIIVMDEVQTVPTKMLTLFNLTINFLSKVCGVTVILCSATQPCFERAAHPMFTQRIDMVPYAPKLWDTFRRTQIQPVEMMRLDAIPAFAQRVLEQANSLLIVCNKKSEAAYLYKALSNGTAHCFHLSAAMCMAHRRIVLNNLQAVLDALKSTLQTSEKKVICVSTQVIEAGVDISFERVIRLSAGMDSVIQSAGRCNRNGESNTPAPVYLVPCQNENLTKLSEIQRGKDATESLLAQYCRCPQQFQNDLSSDEAINDYYRRLYKEMPEGFQDYSIKGKPYSIFSLLSANSCFADDRAESHGNYFLNQAFRLAGSLFQVYDDASLDVIVPYKEGRTIIADLGSERAALDLEYRKECIARAKPYTISLYEYQRKQLEQNHGLLPVSDEDDRIWMLSDNFYDKELGFSLERIEIQFLEV